MKPIGPLMTEHRLIERAIKLLKSELDHFQSEKEFNATILIKIVDFMRTYSDRTHHGKEEDILFRYLALKKLKPAHRDIMEELIAEHKHARKMLTEMEAARIKYAGGNSSAAHDIATALEKLVKFYPEHIEKEDKHFFYPCMDYFTREEQDAMLGEFNEFDRKLIHEKYESIISGIESETA
jgi:hemerythrin-like domain-containing protein